ncbi:MAG: MarR family transcriptional regulator [Clostridiales bacterium]|nr:MarR family transcriptional regulator [Clostridiales bacterium]
MERGSRELIRDMNTSLILQTIIEEGALSRADLAKQLHFSKATVSAIVQSLIERKLVRETGNGSSEIGRKPILWEYEKKSVKV